MDLLRGRGATAFPPGPGADLASPDMGLIGKAVEQARTLENLHALLVSHDGSVVAEQVFRGPALDRAVNIKSASKTVMSALVGIAIDRRVLDGVDQPIGAVLRASIPKDADERVGAITVGNLLSMQAGLERTSGRELRRLDQQPQLGARRAVAARSSTSPAGGCSTRPAAPICCPRS